MNESKFGYSLNGYKYITLPFADDFCLITTNKLTHRRLINDINGKLLSINLPLKPSKCRSISICSGKPKSITFSIGDISLQAVLEKPEQLLCSYITFYSESTETFNVRNKVKYLLINIDNSTIRNEYKMRIFFVNMVFPFYATF